MLVRTSEQAQDFLHHLQTGVYRLNMMSDSIDPLDSVQQDPLVSIVSQGNWNAYHDEHLLLRFEPLAAAESGIKRRFWKRGDFLVHIANCLDRCGVVNGVAAADANCCNGIAANFHNEFTVKFAKFAGHDETTSPLWAHAPGPAGCWNARQ